MKKRILVVEDDPAIARLLKDNLEFEGFVVESSAAGNQAMKISTRFAPDLVLLDLMLSDHVDGMALCRRLTQGPARVPVIIITARSEASDRVRGLTAGADDYVVKPFSLEELLARIRAVLRRTTMRPDHLRLGLNVIDFRQMKVFRDNHEIILTDREFAVLRHLVERAGSVVSRDELLHLVWGYPSVPVTRTVDNFILRLRFKLERDPHNPKFIHTVYGDGYRLTLTD